MVSAVLKNSDRIPEERGSGRYKPSPSELRDAGYRDGINGKYKNLKYRFNKFYLPGYIAGYRANPGSAFNLANPDRELLLVRGHADEILNAI